MMSMKTSYRERDYEYGEAMLKLRTAIGLTQGGLGKLLGVSWRAVAEWEAGSSYPKVERFKALIELAIQHQAFSAGSEAEEIRRLWKVARQKVLLDEDWLCALLSPRSSPQEQEALGIVPTGGTPVEAVRGTDPVPCATGWHGPYSADPVRGSDPVSCAYPLPPLTPVFSVEETMSSAGHRAGSAQASGSEPRTTRRLGARPRHQSDKARGRRKGFVVIVTALVLLTIIGSVGTFFFLARSVTTQTNKTATDPAYPGYLLGKGTLVFFDPLSQAGGSEWISYTDDLTGSACQFTGGAYHVSERLNDYMAWCSPPGVHSNFAFEVQLTITQGDCGGIIFRDEGNWHFYSFYLCGNGTYQVAKHVDENSPLLLFAGNSSVIHEGLGRQNKMAVVASGSTMTFYVNERQINQVQDSSYTSGKMALVAPYFGHAIDVAYSNAGLWRL
jgi:transcriptional regulator with XRE-family HTH domain